MEASLEQPVSLMSEREEERKFEKTPYEMKRTWFEVQIQRDLVSRYREQFPQRDVIKFLTDIAPWFREKVTANSGRTFDELVYVALESGSRNDEEDVNSREHDKDLMIQEKISELYDDSFQGGVDVREKKWFSVLTDQIFDECCEMFDLKKQESTNEEESVLNLKKAA